MFNMMSPIDLSFVCTNLVWAICHCTHCFGIGNVWDMFLYKSFMVLSNNSFLSTFSAFATFRIMGFNGLQCHRFSINFVKACFAFAFKRLSAMFMLFSVAHHWKRLSFVSVFDVRHVRHVVFRNAKSIMCCLVCGSPNSLRCGFVCSTHVVVLAAFFARFKKLFHPPVESPCWKNFMRKVL